VYLEKKNLRDDSRTGRFFDTRVYFLCRFGTTFRKSTDRGFIRAVWFDE